MGVELSRKYNYLLRTQEGLSLSVDKKLEVGVAINDEKNVTEKDLPGWIQKLIKDTEHDPAVLETVANMSALTGQTGAEFMEGVRFKPPRTVQPKLEKTEAMASRSCLRDAIPEIYEAAFYLDEAVIAHLAGRSGLAKELICRADVPAIRDWTESLWGSNSPYVKKRIVLDAPPSFPIEQQVKERMPTAAEKHELQQRDGCHCRFCGIPVIRKEVRERIGKVYPEALPWGRKNPEQHAAFQAMWLQYDHLLPHARGGNNDLENIVITCAPCNFGRMNYTLEEVGLIDPRKRELVRSSWDGLERFR